MKKQTYRTITRQSYSTGIWDNCSATIETNGKRFRVRYDYVRWANDSGSLTEKTVYLERAEGRKLLRQYRTAVINDLKGNYGWVSPLDVILSAGQP